jgi:hypothetical protein
MCGVFGMVGNGIQPADLSFIKSLAWVSALRGTDGTGLLQAGAYRYSYRTPKKFDNYFVEKGQHDISYFSWYHEYHKEGNKKVFNDVTDNLYAGHVRAATLGNVNDQNAHPFELENLIGMHNGTLVDAVYLDKSWQKTDSELMFEDMNVRGIVPVLRDLDDKSAYSVVIWDKSDLTINFATNGKRPLKFAINKKRNVMYWASETWMLTGCAARHGIELAGVWEFEVDHLYSFRPVDVRSEQFPLWTKYKIKPAKSVPMLPESRVSNIVPLPRGDSVQKKDEKRNERKRTDDKFRTLCSECKVEMDLVDQYFAHKVESSSSKESIFVCKECHEHEQLLRGVN